MRTHRIGFRELYRRARRAGKLISEARRLLDGVAVQTELSGAFAANRGLKAFEGHAARADDVAGWLCAVALPSREAE